MSAFSTRLALGARAATTSTARLTTAITSSHSPSTEVYMADVSFGSPDSRTTRTASATASPTLSDSPPSGLTLNAMSTPSPLPIGHEGAASRVLTGNFKPHEPRTAAVRSDRPRGGAVGGADRAVRHDGRRHQHHAGAADPAVRSR